MDPDLFGLRPTLPVPGGVPDPTPVGLAAIAMVWSRLHSRRRLVGVDLTLGYDCTSGRKHGINQLRIEAWRTGASGMGRRIACMFVDRLYDGSAVVAPDLLKSTEAFVDEIERYVRGEVG